MSRNVRRSDRGRRTVASRCDNDRPDTMGTNVYSAKDQQSMHKSLNGEFLLYQILLERLLDDQEDLPRQAKEGLEKYFHPSNPIDEKVMKEFDEEYRCEKAIHWYTRETCIYRMLNKALRTQTIDDVSAFTKLIRDLRKQLIEENAKFVKQHKSSILTVYRGQLIRKDEITRLTSTLGQLISMNSFLSTSTNKDKALEFARSRQPPNDELTRILLEIQVNIRSPSRPFADIKHLSAFAEEEEILFMFGCVFRAEELFYDEDNELWRGKLTLCGDHDQDMKEFLSNLQGEMEGKNRLVALGEFFIEMQKYEEAQDHYEHLIDGDLLQDPIEWAQCHLGLAKILHLKANYNLAEENLEKALNYLLEDERRSEDPLISECYNEFGSIYKEIENYPLAFEFYEKALTMKNNCASTSYLGVGQIHFQMKNYHLAEEFYRQALQRSNPQDFSKFSHLCIALGEVYAARNDEDQASNMFEKAIESQKKHLGEDHPDLSSTYQSISQMYLLINQLDKASLYLQKSFELQLKTLPSNHQDFAQTFQLFASFYEKSGDDEKALEYYQKGVNNLLKTLLWSHPRVAEIYLKIGKIHWKRKEYDQALNCFHQVLDSELDRKNTGDRSLSHAYRHLADLYREKGDPDFALQFYLQYLDNELETKFHEDFSLIEIYQILSKIFYEKRQLGEALYYSNRLLDCFRRKEPINEEQIEKIYRFIGKIYLKKKRFDQSLSIRARKNSNEDRRKHQEIFHQFHCIDHLHDQQRHLKQAYLYFSHSLQQQSKTKKINDRTIEDFNEILAKILYEQGDFSQSLTFYLQLFEMKSKKKKKSLDSPSFEEIYRPLAILYRKVNLFDHSLIYFHRLIDCQMKKSLKKTSPSIDHSYRSIGEIFLEKHFRATFDDHYYHHHHLHHQRRNSSSFSTNVINAMKISSLDFERFHLNETIHFFESLFQRNSFEYFHPEELNIILFHLNLERFHNEQSLFYLQQLLQIQIGRSSIDQKNLSLTYTYFGQVYFNQSRFDQALNSYRLALNILQRKKNSSTDEDHSSLEKSLRHRIREILLPNAF